MVSWLLRAVAELGVWNCLGEHVRSTTVWQKKQSNATNRVERSRWRCSHTCNLTDKKQQHLHTLIQSRLFKALTQLHVYLESIVYLNSAEFPAFVQMRKKMIFKKKQQWQEIKQFLLEITELWVSLSLLHLMTHQLSVICLVCDCCTGFITEEWDMKVWSHSTTEDRFRCVLHLLIIQQYGCCLLLCLQSQSIEHLL